MSFTSYAFNFEYVLHGAMVSDFVERHALDPSMWNLRHVTVTRHFTFLEILSDIRELTSIEFPIGIPYIGDPYMIHTGTPYRKSLI